MINQNSLSKQPQNRSNEDLLIQAARQHKLSVINELIQKGANVNYVLKTNCDSWYSGDTHTPLYFAVHSNFEDQQQYLNVIQALLKAGADPNFKARRGGWNHSTQYPLFSGVPQMLKKFKKQDSKLRFIEIFVKHGVKINQIQRNSRSKDWRGYQKLTCFIFQMMDACGIVSKVDKLRNMCERIDMGQQRRLKQQKMRKKFLQQYPNVIFSEQAYMKPAILQNRNFVTYNTQIIQTLINFGADANSYKSDYFWENNQDEDLFSDLPANEYEKQKRQMRIFTQTTTKQYESILHRAIMNNLPKLVKLLIQKGAKVDKCCEVTVSKPIYPNEWPRTLIKSKLRNNAQVLKQNQQQRHVIEEKIRKDVTLSEEERRKLEARLTSICFSIYQAKRFCIENEFPEMVNETITVSCEEIAMKFGVDESIIQMLKAAKR